MYGLASGGQRTMKLSIILTSFIFAGLLTAVPTPTGTHAYAAAGISNGAQKCIITLPNKKNRASVRTRPDVGARVVGRLRDGVYVNVTRRSRGWAYINGSDQGSIKGWVPEAYISC
jgi:SH3-like domain-containing protein